MNIEEICANSYRNFHAKGLDYLCSLRTPERTVKFYFFDGDVSTSPEIVMPHDHRYPFHTRCLTGEIVDRRFVRWSKRDRMGDVPRGLFDEFAYHTPLNGGDGFTWKRETKLAEIEGRSVHAGFVIRSRATDIHTLKIAQPDTVICLNQYADEVPDGKPTAAFRPVGSREPPNLSGLYDRMDPDHALKLIERIKQIRGTT